MKRRSVNRYRYIPVFEVGNAMQYVWRWVVLYSFGSSGTCQQDEWDEYLACHAVPQATDIPGVNTYA